MLDPNLSQTQLMILVPARELAIQIEQVVRDMGTGFKVNAVYGGRSGAKEKIELTHAPSILVGTPGRVADHIRRDRITLQGIKSLVIDEFDKSLVSKRIILSGDNLLDAQPRMNNETNETVVSFTLDRVGAKRFGKATSKNIGKQLAIVLDGKIISAPVIRDTIASGSGQISGGFTFQTAPCKRQVGNDCNYFIH